MRQTRHLTLALAGAAFAALVGVAQAQDAKTFALVQINQQALFFNQMNEGAQAAADAAGAKLVIFNANNDPAAQNSAIETYITEGVDGIIVVAIDVNGVMPAVIQADEAGIPVVAVDAILPDGPQKAQIGVDNADAGAQIGKYFVDYVAANGGSAKLGIVGALNSFIQNIRQEGFEKTLEGVERHRGRRRRRRPERPGHRAWRGREPDDGKPRPDRDLRHRRAGAARRRRRGREPGAAGQRRRLRLGPHREAVAGIDAGYVKAVVQQDPAGMGEAAVEALAAISAGGTVEPVISVPITIVTKENVDAFRAMFK